MALTKMTMLFNAATVKGTSTPARSGGWSESWYRALAPDNSGLRNEIDLLCQFRAALLGFQASIIGQRVQGVDPVGPARSYERFFPGSAGTEGDLPQVCLTWNMRSPEGTNRRHVSLRGAPDARVVKGEYVPSDSYAASLLRYFGELEDKWLMKGRVRSNPQIPIGGVLIDGTVICGDAHDLTIGDKVIFLRTRNDLRQLVQGIFIVEEIVSETRFKIFNWAHDGFGLISKGKVRKHEEDYFAVEIDDDEIALPDANIRKVGRPFKQFAGRQSAKR